MHQNYDVFPLCNNQLLLFQRQYTGSSSDEDDVNPREKDQVNVLNNITCTLKLYN